MRPRNIFDVIRRFLGRGANVEIDGLGTFRATPDGVLEFDVQTKPQVFIAYVQEDLALARKLRDGLATCACAPWLDKDKLMPGQNWPRAIERAIEISDVFVACFSPRSIAKEGQFQCELRYALDCARRMPLDQVFLVPVRFEACTIPKRITDHVQYVDLFPDWDRGLARIVKAIHRTAKRSHAQLCA